MIIYWDTIKDRAKRKEMSRASKRFLGVGMAINIIALLINMISIYLS